MPVSEVKIGHCLHYMKQLPDGFADIAVVDPPYGIGISSNPVRQKHEKKNWDDSIPDKEYFDELKRVSKNQIIWGGNYFIDYLSNTQGFIIWDKKQPEGLTLAMCEFAYSTIQSPAKIFRYSVMLEKDKIHPTQKPIALYRWIFKNYAKAGYKILDTHLGSQSSRIAAFQMGFDFYGYEIDEQIYNDGCKRFELNTQQLSIGFK